MEASFVRDLGLLLATDRPLKELWVSSAYTTLKGIGVLRNLVAVSDAKRAILGCNVQTEWKALRKLDEWGVQVQIMPDPPDGIYHPKCLFADPGDGTAWVIAGSANLTEGGLRQNIEAGVRIMGPVSIPAIREARRFFEDLTEAAAPLTPELLEHYREAQEEIRGTKIRETPTSMASLVGLDRGQAIMLTPAGRRLMQNIDVGRFLHYIRHTKMEASYKMVILPLVLQSEAGRLGILDLARQFSSFYQLLASAGHLPERGRMVMREIQGMSLPRVISTLKGAPREALSRPGIVLYSKETVEISPKVWDAMSPAHRETARHLAISRLRGYYREHLGYDEDFSRLLHIAQGTSP